VKENIDEQVSKHKHFDSKLKSSSDSQVLPGVVAILSNRVKETDHTFPGKECDSERNDMSRQRNNHAHLRESLPKSVDPVTKFGLVPRVSEQPSYGRFNKDPKAEVRFILSLV